jgi:hypothetical protein
MNVKLHRARVSHPIAPNRVDGERLAAKHPPTPAHVLGPAAVKTDSIETRLARVRPPRVPHPPG